MYRICLVVPLVSLCVAAAPVVGQVPELPTPEEYAERAAQAESAPLFASEEPLRVTLRTDIGSIPEVLSPRARCCSSGSCH